ncbi:MAG TPA: hypothetical protein V6C81_01410 [Planktothrix sp.]
MRSGSKLFSGIRRSIWRKVATACFHSSALKRGSVPDEACCLAVADREGETDALVFATDAFAGEVFESWVADAKQAASIPAAAAKKETAQTIMRPAFMLL